MRVSARGRKLARRRSEEPKALIHGSDISKDNAYLHYDMTVAMLNKTMGLCLR